MSDRAHSVAERLLNLCKARNEEFTFVLSRYGTERLLYRLAQSEHGRRFVLKGASLFLVWFGQAFRTTRDVDLLGEGPADLETVAETFRGICRLETRDIDGLVFQPESVVVSRIREDQQHDGIRVKLRALLSRSRIDLQVDIGFGDAVTPAPEPIEFPTLLDAPAPQLLAYPHFTAIAEKFHAMVSRDLANSRMKDFYDLIILFRSFDLNEEILARAIKNSFACRGTALPVDIPMALTSTFGEDEGKMTQWEAFKKKNRLTQPMGSLQDVIEELCMRFTPVLMRLRIPN
jgi:hypothetical protein